MSPHRLSPQEAKQLDRQIQRKIHADRHTTVAIIADFVQFLRITGNIAALDSFCTLDTPGAMAIRRRAYERSNKKKL